MIKYCGHGDLYSRSLIAAAARAMAEGAKPPMQARMHKAQWVDLARECPMLLWSEGAMTGVKLMACSPSIDGPRYVALLAVFDEAAAEGVVKIHSGAHIVAEVLL